MTELTIEAIDRVVNDYLIPRMDEVYGSLIAVINHDDTDPEVRARARRELLRIERFWEDDGS